MENKPKDSKNFVQVVSENTKTEEIQEITNDKESENKYQKSFKPRGETFGFYKAKKGKETSKTETFQTETFQTETFQTETIKIETIKTENIKTETIQAENIKTETIQTETINIETIQIETNQKGSIQTETNQTGSIQTGSNQTETKPSVDLEINTSTEKVILKINFVKV